MQNILFDINIILDCYDTERLSRFPASKQALDLATESALYQAYLSCASLDNLEFLKARAFKQSYPEATASQCQKLTVFFIKDILTRLRIAKTPAYFDLDFADIEDSLIIASAQAIDARVITRDGDMLKKYPEIALTADQFLTKHNETTENIPFLDLKSAYQELSAEIDQGIDRVLNSGWYILGPAVDAFEADYAAYCEASHCVGVANGLDALHLALLRTGHWTRR